MKHPRLLATLAFLLVFAIAGFATAAPLPAGMTAVPLAAITNDRDSSVSEIKLMVNKQDSVSGIYLETRANAHSNPSQAKGKVYWLAGIESPQGVVLGQGQGVKAIVVQGTIQSQAGHGSLTIHYLTNGLFGHYAQCQVDLQRLAPHDWQLVNAYNGQPVQHIKVQTWMLGISTLGNICPSSPA